MATNLTEKVEVLRNRLEGLERRVSGHQPRIYKLEDRVGNLEHSINTLSLCTELKNERSGELGAETKIFSELLKMGVKGLVVSDGRGGLVNLLFS